MPDLSLVPTAELLDTLFNRYDNAIFHGTLARPIAKEDKTTVYSIRSVGDAYYAMGLAHGVIHFLNQELDATRDELDAKDL